MSKELFERNVYGGPDGRHHRRYRGASTGYRFRDRFGSFARKRYYHCYHCGIHHFPVGRQQSPDRRSYRSIYRHYLWHHTTIRRGRTDCSHADGGRTPCIIRSVQAGSCHQIHSLSYHRRIYQRYRRHYFHDPDCRYFRFIFRRRESAGRLRREVADLFPSLRHDQLVEYHR